MPGEIPTPIPLGSPHVSQPPMLDRWKVGARRTGTPDRRDYLRRALHCDLWLRDVESDEILRCMTDDISDAGVSGSAPIGYGLAIGRRVEMRIANTTSGRITSAQLAADLGYGTIVRSQVRLRPNAHDRVSFAVRFDVPRLLPV